MKKRTKLTLAGIVAVTGLLALAGCTKSFCSNVDTARMLYAFDNGVTLYEAGGETEEFKTTTGLTYVVKNFTRTYALWDEPTGEKCPNCGNYLVKKLIRGKEVIKCSNSKCDYKKD